MAEQASEISRQPNTLTLKLDPAEWHQPAREFLRHHNIGTQAAPSIEKLGDVLQAFIAIPYENLSKIIKFQQQHQDAAALRFPDEVWQDFRRYHLGGTCFSLTFFLHAILHELGFTAYPVMARMNTGANRHCALIVLHEDEHYLVDPGYVLDVPLLLKKEGAMLHRSAHTGVIVSPTSAGDEFDVFTFNRENRTWRYAFRDAPVSREAFLQHWLESFSWNGMNALCLTRNHKDKLIYIRENYFRETGLEGKRQYYMEGNREQVIEQVFGIPAQVIEQADAALRQIRKARGYFDKKRS